MAADPRKRQKKLEKRKAKQKEKKKELVRRKPDDVSARLQRAATAPFLHCCANDTLWDEGITNLLVSRTLPDGKVAVAVFLVDTYCLGIKDATVRIMTRTRYDSELFGRLYRGQKIINFTPECARKLVEGAVEYAQSLGFPPHEDYRQAKHIFGEVDAAACPQEFEYGKDGKPFFIAGPNDSPGRINRVMETLRKNFGPDQMHYLLPVDPEGLSDYEVYLDDEGAYDAGEEDGEG